MYTLNECLNNTETCPCWTFLNRNHVLQPYSVTVLTYVFCLSPCLHSTMQHHVVRSVRCVYKGQFKTRQFKFSFFQKLSTVGTVEIGQCGTGLKGLHLATNHQFLAHHFTFLKKHTQYNYIVLFFWFFYLMKVELNKKNFLQKKCLANSSKHSGKLCFSVLNVLHICLLSIYWQLITKLWLNIISNQIYYLNFRYTLN